MANNAPTHVVFLVPARGRDTSWTAVGSAWRNRDGSMNIVLNAPAPKGARLQLRARKRSLETMAAERATQLEKKRARRRPGAATRAAQPRFEDRAGDGARVPDGPRGGGVHIW